MPKMCTDEEYANMPCICVLYIGSLELLWWNTGGSICFTKFNITKHLRMYTEQWGILIPALEWVQNVNSGWWRGWYFDRNSLKSVNSIYKMTGVAQTCAWRIFHSDGLYLCYLQVVQHFLLGDYAKCLWFCEWMQPQARLCATFCAWMTFNLPGWCHQHKEFAFLRTGKSTWCCTMSFWTLMFG